MCGIVGIFSQNNQKFKDELTIMVNSLELRGPDDSNIWTEENIALGHVRLSIHDLSSSGRQPMESFSQRWVLVFNGEIYNYKSIKKELLKQKKISFKSESDTEVLVNAIDVWGVEKTLKKCRGMFAFAVWDKKEKQLILARDRFGEKPLYYGVLNNNFVFSSELKPFQKAYKSKLEIDRNVLASFMRYAYVPTPYCIYKGLHKLKPGCYIVVNKHLEVKESQYWSSKNALNQQVYSGDYQSAISVLEEKLSEVLKIQMLSDVPLGAFLSGGVDSSLIVALMQKESKDKIKTFSIGFNDKQFNEAEYARVVAKHIGTEHTDMYVAEKEALAVIPELSKIYDEPFADSSQIPTYLVSKIAKRDVTVSLSGDAGDELFGGYNRYLLADSVKQKIMNKPLVKTGLKYTPSSVLKILGSLSKKHALLSDKLIKLQKVILHSHNSEFDLYKNLCTQIYTPNKIVLNSNELSIYKDKGLLDLNLSYVEWMMYADSQTYMMDDILTKVDRAAMANSLETRIPFLDHEIFEFAWSLPLEYKIRKGVGKSILREILYKHVPKKLIERPKMGFGVPLASWLRGELKEWAWELIKPDRIRLQGYLDHNEVLKYWSEHQSGKRNWQYALWNILIFQQWLNAMHGK